MKYGCAALAEVLVEQGRVVPVNFHLSMNNHFSQNDENELHLIKKNTNLKLL